MQALDELAWELHVATQVPAQLVGLAAACDRRWRLGWCGPGSGPVGVLGESLAGWPGKGLAVARCRPRQGLVALLGKDLADDRCLLILI